ncbi:MAG: histidine kinase [Sphingobacterium sp.]|nr:histidine kinase [Sphingobacterium sp.]
MSIYNTTLLASLYYMLIYCIYPYAIGKKKYFAGILTLILLFIFFAITDAYLERQILNACSGCMTIIKNNNPSYYTFLHLQFSNMLFKRLISLGLPLGIMIMLAVPISIKVGLNALRNAYAKAELIQEKAKIELDLLKSQINPHFLFNSLNNIYGLILNGKTDQSALLVSRLSELLRYTIYEANNEYLIIQEEIRLIKNYLELEKIRLNHTKVTFEMKIDHWETKLPALILMPLVENAFKHVVDVPGSFIRFVIQADRQQLYFMEENTMVECVKKMPAGFGLKHLVKRLNFFYPNRHEYEIIEQKDSYRVTLTCML